MLLCVQPICTAVVFNTADANSWFKVMQQKACLLKLADAALHPIYLHCGNAQYSCSKVLMQKTINMMTLWLQQCNWAWGQRTKYAKSEQMIEEQHTCMGMYIFLHACANIHEYLHPLLQCTWSDDWDAEVAVWMCSRSAVEQWQACSLAKLQVSLEHAS